MIFLHLFGLNRGAQPKPSTNSNAAILKRKIKHKSQFFDIIQTANMKPPASVISVLVLNALRDIHLFTV